MLRELQEKHIYPIRIPTPFAVGDVFSYLIRDEKTVLVDCGPRSDEAFMCIKRVMDEQHLSLADLDEIWLTHGHPDHFGQARVLAGQSGAVLLGHKKERLNFAGNKDGKLFEAFFKAHHIPDEQIVFMTEQIDWLRQFQDPVNPGWISGQDALTSGRMNFEVRHTPGHAPGHLAFVSDDGIIFGGDILLEHISTNALINFDPDTGERNESLLQYRESLKWIGRQEGGVVLPGHGSFIKAIKEVADQHLEEHEKRYDKISRLLEGRPYSLYELGQVLFPDAMKKGAVFLVLSEVLGYLDWGINEGRIRLDDGIYSISR